MNKTTFKTHELKSGRTISMAIGDEIRFTVDDHPVIAKILGFETNGVRVRDEIKSYLVGAERIEAVFPKFK